jgi:RNA polymerase-binding transcription factor DksA
MTPEFIEERKQALMQKKKELEEQLKTFTEKGEGDDYKTKFPEMNESSEDKVDEVEEYENLLPVEYSLEEDLKDVNEALGEIEEGTYGKCKGCDCEIPEERLLALPEARTCLNCEECHCDECEEGE